MPWQSSSTNESRSTMTNSSLSRNRKYHLMGSVMSLRHSLNTPDSTPQRKCCPSSSLNCSNHWTVALLHYRIRALYFILRFRRTDSLTDTQTHSRCDPAVQSTSMQCSTDHYKLEQTSAVITKTNKNTNTKTKDYSAPSFDPRSKMLFSPLLLT